MSDFRGLSGRCQGHYNIPDAGVAPTPRSKHRGSGSRPKRRDSVTNCGCSSVVERFLAKEEAEGANPFTRSGRRGREVRQGSAKPFYRGANPLDASAKATIN